MYSKILVVIQFLLISALAVYCKNPFSSILTAVIFCLGIILGAAAMFTMKIHNLRIQPIPKSDAILITNGVYRFVRHPMYASVLQIMLALLIAKCDIFSITLFLALLCTLLVKLLYEEKLLQQKFPEYSNYKKHSWRIIPYIF